MDLRNGALILLAFAGFAGVHSVLAGAGIKHRFGQWFGVRVADGWYRLAYNLFAVLTILPAFALTVLLPDRLLYTVGLPWSLLLRAVQIVGVLGLAGALLVTDVWHFAGVRQAAAYLAGDPLPLPEPALQERGMYRLTRHPLYFFTLLAVWPLPSMTLNFLFFNIGVTLYIIVGSLVEERRLLRVYGHRYRDYRRRVSWLIPFPPRRGTGDGDLAQGQHPAGS